MFKRNPAGLLVSHDQDERSTSVELGRTLQRRGHLLVVVGFRRDNSDRK